MKSTGIFIGAVLGLSFLVSIAMLVTATMKPEWFMYGAKPAQAEAVQSHAKKDSTSARDSSHVLTADNTDTAAPTPALVPAQADHQTPAPATQKAPSSVDKKEAGTAAVLAQAIPAGTTKEEDLQNLVKLYEAMKPQDAAKILGKMQDKEVRSIVLHCKKKQAAKILSFFDANRAAQILAQ